VPISLHHAQVFYPPGEEAQARDFYGKSLGLDEIHRPETLSDRGGIWYSAPPGHVHLSADQDLGLHPRRHFALRVDDLEMMRNRCASAALVSRKRRRSQDGIGATSSIRSATRSSWTEIPE
jgi:hypothetical protein